MGSVRAPVPLLMVAAVVLLLLPLHFGCGCTVKSGLGGHASFHTICIVLLVPAPHLSNSQS